MLIDPNHFESYFGRGTCFDALSKYAKALEDYNAALALKSDRADIWYAKADALVHCGRRSEALLCFKTSLELRDNDPECWYDYGMALLESARTFDALDSFRYALRHAPQWIDAYVALARTHALMGDFSEASVCLIKANALDPSKKDQIRAYLQSVLPQATLASISEVVRNGR